MASGLRAEERIGVVAGISKLWAFPLFLSISTAQLLISDSCPLSCSSLPGSKTGGIGGGDGSASSSALSALTSQAHLLDWADKTFGQGLSTVTKTVKTLGFGLGECQLGSGDDEEVAAIAPHFRSGGADGSTSTASQCAIEYLLAPTLPCPQAPALPPWPLPWRH